VNEDNNWVENHDFLKTCKPLGFGPLWFKLEFLLSVHCVLTIELNDLEIFFLSLRIIPQGTYSIIPVLQIGKQVVKS
jgi:hypothetical protein